MRSLNGALKVTKHNMSPAYLIRLLVLLKVSELGYPLEKFDEALGWLNKKEYNAVHL